MIRKYRPSDIEEIIDTWFQASLLAHPFLDAVFLEKEKQNIREIYIPNTETWVFEEDGRVAGFIAMMGNEVGAIFVRPEKQGKGVGKQLMDSVASQHRELDVEVFEKNSIGRAFYDRYGFKLISERIHEETNHRLLRMRFVNHKKVAHE